MAIEKLKSPYIKLPTGTPEELIKYLTGTLNVWNKAYYGDKPVVSDTDFDGTLRLLIKLEKENPEFALPDSPSKLIGKSTPTGKLQITHGSKMYSLDNVFNMAEFRIWLKGITSTYTGKWCIEMKYDGLAMELVYVDGILTTASSRGDGVVGEDMLLAALHMSNVPTKISKMGRVEVTGEVLMFKDSFAHVNELRIASGEEPYINPRNACAGACRLLKGSEIKERGLSFFVYACPTSDNRSLHGRLKELSTLGFVSSPCTEYLSTNEGIEHVFQAFNNMRSSLPYEIDGVVYKVDDVDAMIEFGFTNKFPLGAIAFKFPADAVETDVDSITFQVGRTGVITPVAELVPVKVGGVTVARCTLHNEDELNRLDLYYGDTVLVERAGDVIPKIREVIISDHNTANRKDPSRKVTYPEHCPCCGGDLIKEKVYIKCISGITCPAQRLNSITRFCSKKVTNIEGLAEATCNDLINAFLIKVPSDIFKLKYGMQGRIVDGIKPLLIKGKKYRKILNNIQQARDISLSKFIYALAIPGVGSTTSNDLAEKYRNFDAFRVAPQKELIKIPDVGPTISHAIVDFFNSEVTATEVDELLKAFKIRPMNDKGESLYGKRFVITGSFEGIDRAAITAYIEAESGKVSSSISGGTTALILGKNAGSKLITAQSKGVEVYTWPLFKDKVDTLIANRSKVKLNETTLKAMLTDKGDTSDRDLFNVWTRQTPEEKERPRRKRGDHLD